MTLIPLQNGVIVRPACLLVKEGVDSLRGAATANRVLRADFDGLFQCPARVAFELPKDQLRHRWIQALSHLLSLVEA